MKQDIQITPVFNNLVHLKVGAYFKVHHIEKYFKMVNLKTVSMGL